MTAQTLFFYAVLVSFAYLLGSVSAAIVTSRLMGLPDPRSQGSGNPGATNVLRIGGKKAAAITLAGDLAKGLLPVLLAKFLGTPLAVQALVGLGAFLGHLYPLYFGFRGGKGVATLIGVLFGIAWLLGIGYVLTWLAVAAVTRLSSLSALVAASLAPLYAWLLESSAALGAVVALMSLLLIWRHRSNIRKLLDGTEDRIGAR